MEHFKKIGGYRMLARILALCLVIAVCSPLTLTAHATHEEAKQEQPETGVVQDTTATVAQETTATAAQETTEASKPVSVVSNEEIDTAMTALLKQASLSENDTKECWQQRSSVIPSLDLLEAIENYTITLRLNKEIQVALSRIQQCRFLDGEDQLAVWTVLNSKLPISEDVKNKILSLLQNPTDYLSSQDENDQAYLEWVEECNALMDAQDRWDALGKRIEKLNDQLKARKDQGKSTEDFISEKIDNIVADKTNLELGIKEYLISQPDGRGGEMLQDGDLLSKIQELENRVDMLWLDISFQLMETDEENAKVLKELKILVEEQQTQIGKTKSRPIFGFIALGVSVLAVIMGIVATVLALRQPSKPEEEQEDMASRRDVEALEKQNTYLRNRLEKLEKRTDDANASVQEYMDQLCGDLRDDLRKEIEQIETVIRGEPNPPKPPLPPKDPIALRLNYQSLSPENSYLTEDKTGIYQLWEDSTVTLNPESMDKMNEFGSWRASGLLYMYWPVVNGRELNPDNILPSGFYQPKEILKPAQVSKNSNGTYALVERGSVKMIAF